MQNGHMRRSTCLCAMMVELWWRFASMALKCRLHVTLARNDATMFSFEFCVAVHSWVIVIFFYYWRAGKEKHWGNRRNEQRFEWQAVTTGTRLSLRSRNHKSLTSRRDHEMRQVWEDPLRKNMAKEVVRVKGIISQNVETGSFPYIL